MIYLIHLFVGLVIGGYFHSIPLIIILAFASHFVIDMLPHWDGPYDKAHFEKTGKLKAHKLMYFIEITDFLIVIAILIYFADKTVFFDTKMMLGAIFSILPDVLKVGYFTPLRKNKYFMKYLQFHSKIQNEVGWKKGIFYQLVVLAVFLILFKTFS